MNNFYKAVKESIEEPELSQIEDQSVIQRQEDADKLNEILSEVIDLLDKAQEIIDKYENTIEYTTSWREYVDEGLIGEPYGAVDLPLSAMADKITLEYNEEELEDDEEEDFEEDEDEE